MPYETIDEAIEIANGTDYGLGASVFGPDQEECVKVAKELECGMVSINDFGVFYVSAPLCISSSEQVVLTQNLDQVC
jgi:acyl-CoA reductase-like NAD-dependent aldehyde dehydrogenase